MVTAARKKPASGKKPLNEQTSQSVAAIAARLLRDPKTPADVRKVAASALTQAPHKSQRITP